MSSLRNWDDRIGRIIFHIRGVRGAVVLTEGPTDVFVLEGLLSRKYLLDVAGKVNVLRLSEGLIENGEHGFVAVFDRDFEKDELADLPHLHPYHGNDLESMLIDMGLLRDLLTVSGQADKLEVKGGADAVVDKLRECVAPVSRLRKASALNGWGLNFEDCDFSRFVDAKTLRLDIDRFCSSLYNHRMRSQSLEECPVLEELKSAAKADSAEPLCRGKDVLAAAGVSLRQYVGNLNKAQVSFDQLAGSLYLAAKHAIGGSVWAESLLALLDSRAA